MLNLLSVPILVALVASAAVITLAAGQFISEDSVFWNRYLMGNRQCGDVGHIAGFMLGR
jgi:hypothetical protein